MGHLLTQFGYAVIKDHNETSDRLDPCKSALYQTYDNLMRKKDDPHKKDGVENRFSIQSEVKQHLAYILRSVGAEISKLELTEDAKTQGIINDLSELYLDDSVAAPFLQLGITYYAQCGKTAKGTVDETNWIQNQIIGMLPGLKTKLHLVAEITTAFDHALRVCAWFMGRSVWFGAEKSISSEVFINILSMPTLCTYSLNTLDLISKEVRPKEARKVKAKEVAAASSVDTTSTTDTTAVVTPNSHTAAVVPSTDTAVMSAPVASVVPPGDNINADIQKVLEGI